MMGLTIDTQRTWLTLIALLLTVASLRAQFNTVIIAENVNVRTCGNTQCPVIDQVSKGQNVQILEQSSATDELGYGLHPWYRIRYGNTAEEGFVFGAFVEVSGLYEVEPVQATYNGKGDIVTGVNVNVRSCASTICKVKFQVNRGDQIKVHGQTKAISHPGLGAGIWYKIEYQGQMGYIYGAYIDAGAIPAPSAYTGINAGNFKVGSKGTIIGDRVNLRSRPDLKSRVIDQMYIGDNCTLLKFVPAVNSSEYPWYEVDFNGRKGYAYGQYISTAILGVNTTNIKVWAVVVGISDYSSSVNNTGIKDLTYCEKDARNVYQLLKSPLGGNLPDEQIILLRNGEATSQGISLACQTIYQQAGPDDLIFFYFSGHGGPNYFCAYDAPLSHSDLSELIDASPAQRRLCVADACFSGAWSQHLTSTAQGTKLDDERLVELYYKALANSSTGIAFLMSSSKHETSIEAPQYDQGLFTYFYIEGLKGSADGNNDNIVTLKELFVYVKRKVNKMAFQLYRHSQTPVLKGEFDENMPLSVIKN